MPKKLSGKCAYSKVLERSSYRVCCTAASSFSLLPTLIVSPDPGCAYHTAVMRAFQRGLRHLSLAMPATAMDGFAVDHSKRARAAPVRVCVSPAVAVFDISHLHRTLIATDVCRHTTEQGYIVLIAYCSSLAVNTASPHRAVMNL